MEDEKDAFYIVRKGGIIGVYRSLSECQEQAGSSVSHPAMSVYKGYGWPKEAEEFVSSFGIKNALFSVNASYVKDYAFGKLIPCPVQQPFSSQGDTFDKSSAIKRPLEETVKQENPVYALSLNRVLISLSYSNVYAEGETEVIPVGFRK